MRIERATVYRVNGRDFPSVEKAEAHIDDLAAEIIKKSAMERGFSLSETVRLTESILAVREQLVPLLTVEYPDDDGD